MKEESSGSASGDLTGEAGVGDALDVLDKLKEEGPGEESGDLTDEAGVGDALDVLDKLKEESSGSASGDLTGEAGVGDALDVLDKLKEQGPGGASGDLTEEAGVGDAPKEYLVSAIVSTYNSERFIRGCLEDLEAQTIADKVEIIVIDSHSPQNERAIVEEFQRRCDNIVYLRTDERESVYGAWTRGIKMSRGKYITNANTDDRHRKEAYETMVNVLEARPEISLVYADLLITDTENETFEKCTPVGKFRWMEWDREDLLKQGCFMGPQPMWRREVHEEYGYFDDSFIISGDYEFWLRISQTREFHHLPELLGLYLRAPGSIEHANRPRQREENATLFTVYREAADSGRIIRRPGPDGTVQSMMKEAPKTAGGKKAAPPRPRVSIILTAANQKKYIRDCLESIRAHTPESHEIIIVNNGAAKGVAKWLKKKCRAAKHLRLIKGRKTAGPAEWWNQGVKEASGDFLLFTHNDAAVSDGWLTAMLDALEADPEFGVAGPMTNARGGVQDHPEARFRSMDKFKKYAEAFRTRNRGRRVETRELAEFCLLCRREALEKADGFDDRYKSDAVMVKDFCTRVSLEGWRSVIAADALVHHHDVHADPGRKNDELARVARDTGVYLKKWRPLATEGPASDLIKNRDTLDTAIKRFREERVDEAVKTLSDRIVEHPGDIRLYHALSRFCLDAEQYQAALGALEAIPPDPSGRRDVHTLELGAASLENMKKYDEAQNLADEALRLRPDSAPALNVKGLIAYNRGDKDGAEKLFNQAMAADPGCGAPRTNLGSLKWHAGDQEEALAHYARGFTLDPVSPGAVTLYHTVATGLGALQDA
ncbi:MAG: glycosyltransferase, partial [Desulfobacterales bacterium]|nr:glycosyltransferase [Desulfobacterales bacterium]